jgi:DNA-binding transcriptional ArsR family regulator
MADVELVDVLRAVADPTRLYIVGELRSGEPRAKSMEGWKLDITKSTMSHHFKILREAGVTRTIVEGRNHAIQLRRDELDAKFPGLIEALTSDAG